MRQLYLFGLLALLWSSVVSTHAHAQTPPSNDDDDEEEHNTEEPKEAEKPAPDAAGKATVAPALPVPAPVEAAAAPVTKPKFGDLSVSGYLRAGYGASSQKGRMSCFSLATPGGVKSK